MGLPPENDNDQARPRSWPIQAAHAGLNGLQVPKGWTVNIYRPPPDLGSCLLGSPERRRVPTAYLLPEAGVHGGPGCIGHRSS